MKKKLFGIFLILIIISSILIKLSTISFSSQQVSLQLVPNPKVDIVVTKSRTTTNIDSFKNDIINKLKELGVNTANINVSSIEGQNVDMKNSFSWQQDKSSSIGSINIEDNGQTVTMKGNETNAGKNAIWIMPEQGQEQEFTFNYDITFGDSFKAAGMLLRVEEVGSDRLKGYALSFNKTGSSSDYDYYSLSGSSNAAIWEFDWTRGQNSTNMTKTFKKALDIQTSGELTVKVTDTEITVNGGGLSSEQKYILENAYGNGFGFFSDHYSHNCEEIGSFQLTNIKLNTTIVKKYSEVLRNPEWRDNAIKVLVSVEDYVNTELTDKSVIGELLTRLLGENIYFVSWGKSSNRSQIESLIKSNNNDGIFIENTNYTTSINATADYIKKLIGDVQQSNEYLLLNDSVNIKITPEEFAKGTADDRYPYGKWRIDHNFLYYENHIGQFSNSGKYIEDFIDSFDKTGEYTITYEDSAIVPQKIYVHRRPTALISSTKSGNSITLTSNSYDLDKYSQGTKGIQKEEWKYKKTTETDWHTGKLTTLTSGADYVIQLRVQDYQGVWSYPTSIYTTDRRDAAPIASFGIQNNKITKYEDLELIDASYDPYGGTITKKTWEITKDGSKVYSGSSPQKRYTQEGIYIVKLTVENDRGLKSQAFSRSFEVIEDEIAPEVVVNPAQCDWKRSESVNVTFTDQGGSEFKEYYYAITDDQNIPSQWIGPIQNANDNITISEEGQKYLHIKARDNAGNESEDRVSGPYKIDRTAPTITASPESQEWTQSVNVNLQFSDGSGSGFNSYQYMISTSPTTPGSGWSGDIANANDTITIQTDGIQYLYVKAKDNINNTSEVKRLGPYYIDRTAPTITASPESQGWTQSVNVNLEFTDGSGSGFNSYQYILSTSTTTPESGWSGDIANASDTITITTEGIQYLYIKAKDNINNTSEVKRLGPYYIDRTAPTVTENPKNCEWTQSVDVNLQFSDGSGSGFNSYQYIISTSSTPQEQGWSEERTNANDTITINTDGIQYLHVKAKDNINNISEVKVFGPYYIDVTPPEELIEYSTEWSIDRVIIHWKFEDSKSRI